MSCTSAKPAAFTCPSYKLFLTRTKRRPGFFAGQVEQGFGKNLEILAFLWKMICHHCHGNMHAGVRFFEIKHMIIYSKHYFSIPSLFQTLHQNIHWDARPSSNREDYYISS